MLNLKPRDARRLRIRANAQSKPAAAIAQMVEGINANFADYRARNDARFRELSENQDELNRRVALSGVNGDAMPGRPRRLTTEVRDGIVAVLSGQSRSLPLAIHRIGDDPSGGYAVIPELDNLIDPTVRRQNALRRLAKVVVLPLGVGSYKKLFTASGAAIAWATEVSTRTPTTEAQLGGVEIGPCEMYARASMSQWLLDDNGAGVQDWVGTEVAGAMFDGEGDAFINGNGTTQPRGLVTYATSSELDDTVRAFGTVAYVPTGAPGAFAGSSASPGFSPADVLVDLTLALAAGYRANATWLMSSATAGVIRKVKDQDGRYIWTDSLVAGQPAMLLGYPVEIDESMPTIAADSLSIAFGDFARAYIIVDRPGIRLVSDPFTTPGTVNSYWFRRVGGGLGDSRAVKFLKFSAS